MSKEGIVTIRLSQEEIDQLDVHTGVVSRSQVVRVLIVIFRPILYHRFHPKVTSLFA